MKKIELSNYNTLLFFLTRGCLLGIMTNNLYAISKQNSYISIIIGGILGILPLLMYYYIIKRYPNKNILEIIKKTLGNKLSFIINILLSLFIFLYATSIFYNLITFISSQYLARTPKLAIGIALGLCFCYLINKGINTIAKTSTILFYIFILAFFLSFFGLISQLDFSNLYPMLEHGITPIFKGSFNLISLSITPIFLLTIIPYNKINNNKKILKSTIIYYVIGILSILTVNIFVTTIYGIKMANLIQYPEFHILKRLSLIGFIERFEGILSIQWLFGIILSIVTSLSFIKIHILKLSQRKNNQNNTIIDIILTILLIISVSYIFKNDTSANFFYKNYFPYLNFIFFFILPFIIFVFNCSLLFGNI